MFSSAQCLFTLARLCLFDPSAITVEGDASWQATGDVRYFVQGHRYEGAVGRLVLSVDVPVTHRFDLSYGIEHRSFLETAHDRGEERGFVGFTWKPFAALRP